MDIALLRKDVISQLWAEYRKTHEYRSGLTKAIPPHHIIVEKREKLGLKMIYTSFVSTLRSENVIGTQFKERTTSEWELEWKKMHSTLFKYVYRKNGEWRKMDIRFGTPGDEDLHKIPRYQMVPNEMHRFTDELRNLISLEYKSNWDKVITLAKIHYQFIRIHPFPDGNGRIARAITDQIAVYFGLPVAMVGYPRHQMEKREQYHKAIRSCVDDPECKDLALWINSYIEEQLARLA